jgi:hypothetical protein
MSPAKKYFYVLSLSDDPKEMFFKMLDKCTHSPMLADWQAYLWAEGEAAGLIDLLYPAQCRGAKAWKVKADPDSWSSIITAGLQSQAIQFSAKVTA